MSMAAQSFTKATTLNERFSMKILVIGGAGTVGSEVVKALRQRDADFRVPFTIIRPNGSKR